VSVAGRRYFFLSEAFNNIIPISYSILSSPYSYAATLAAFLGLAWPFIFVIRHALGMRGNAPGDSGPVWSTCRPDEGREFGFLLSGVNWRLK